MASDTEKRIQRNSQVKKLLSQGRNQIDAEAPTMKLIILVVVVLVFFATSTATTVR